jgi:DNA polymerase-3 subunit epsilon
MSVYLDAIRIAKQIIGLHPVYLDTETTGLKQSDEIIEIAIVDSDGQPLLDTLIRPSQPIPTDSTVINGITNEMVKGAPFWPEIWQLARSQLAGKLIIAYNARFDERMLRQSNDRYHISWQATWQFRDLLELYSMFRGDWNSFTGITRSHSLDEARRSCGIALPNAHRALADTLLARELLLYLSKAGG